MFKPKSILLAVVVLALAACGAVKRDPSADAEARRVFDQVHHRQAAAVIPRLDPKLQGPQTATTLDQLANYLPAREPIRRTEVTTSSATVTGQGQTVRMEDEYDFGDRRALAETVLHRANDKAPWLIQGFHIQVATAAELAANRFTLSGKPIGSLLFLAYAIATPLLMVAALIKVIRTNDLRRKWLWAILAFVGLFIIRLDWSTGHFSFVPFTLQIIGFGVVRLGSSFNPWIVSATVPLGALLILTGVWANPKRAKPRPAAEPAGPAPAPLADSPKDAA